MLQSEFHPLKHSTTYLLEVHFRLEHGGKEAHSLVLQVVEGADTAHCQTVDLIILTDANATISLHGTQGQS